MDRRFPLGLWVVLGGTALLLSLLIQDIYLRSILNLMAISALLATSLRFVMLMGELNFALAAFTGLGAYSAGYLSTALGLPFAFAVLVAGVITALASAVFGAITLRAKGPYFLLIGFAFSEAMRVAYSKIDAVGGTSGMVGIYPPRVFEDWMPFIVVSTVLLLLLAFYLVERSNFGRILFAIRENEDVARSVGIRTYICKVIAISGACFAAGLAGGLHAFVNQVISPGDFSYLLAAFALAYVKIGGEDNFLGPIVGAVLLVALSSYAIGFGGDEHFLYGGAIIIAVLLMPKGVLGLLGKLRLNGAALIGKVSADAY
ncbi:branched-chain amino acid ABC transporter permease [Rhizobium glycinendophyticum]|uniref:Branched-chain amino acid ABC transporter permease n=1 Tax=Rhizobium glycinendophyticum TaxID=2589807 RepID=A0A504TU95_9HYPH|nr:branched-chain amino acid ABC transporter permease [Rhizobium glycinendophyticum]TPP05017.1 branched-chain amino acid ABC transporter permease [Rhizobium glycinendophyticum]